MANKVADTLDRARALIEKGWTRQTFSNGEGCYCALGAIMQAKKCNVFKAIQTREVDAFQKVIGSRNIPIWNDAPERTQAEVIQAFKEAAALARAGAL